MTSPSDPSAQHLFYGFILAQAIRWTRDSLLALPLRSIAEATTAEFWVGTNALAVALYQLRGHLERIKFLEVDWVGASRGSGRSISLPRRRVV